MLGSAHGVRTAHESSIVKMSHIAVAVPSIEKAAKMYRDALGAVVSTPQSLPEHGVVAAFVRLGNTELELLEPLGESSPIQRFLEKNPNGSIHHVCIQVSNLSSALRKAEENGLKVIGDNVQGKVGAHGNPVAFLHPKDTYGTLIELEQAPEQTLSSTPEQAR